jgi:hypothetical protein
MLALSYLFALTATGLVAYAAPHAQNNERQACVPAPIGTGPRPSEDTPEAFQAYTPFANAALNAVTPSGYVISYRNYMVTYNEPSQFIDFEYLDTYDVDECTYVVFLCSSPGLASLYWDTRKQWP